MKKKTWIWLALAAVLLLVWLIWDNQRIVVSRYAITDDRLPEGFAGYRIAQISDLHNAAFGEGNSELLELLHREKPDIIVITGDLVDNRVTDVDVALSFAAEAVKIAPCYYVTGNHESRIEEYTVLRSGLEDLGVTVLESEAVILERNGDTIQLVGLSDYLFYSGAAGEGQIATMLASIADIDTDGYTILLQHRPELMHRYDGMGFELLLSGHAHGGQFRLPLLGGLYAPDQGIFPRYDCGVYQEGNMTMVVSRGLGNSIFPFRVNNPAEVVIVTLSRG